MTRVGGENRLQTVDVGLTTGVAGVVLNGHIVVAVNADGLLVPADGTDITVLGNVVGVIEHAYDAGATVSVRQSGTIDNLGWSWTPNIFRSSRKLMQSWCYYKNIFKFFN